MIKATLVLCSLLAATLFGIQDCAAKGNLASRGVRLDPLKLTGDLGFSVKEYKLETGKYYRWRIESDGGEEFMVQAPELMRNIWVDEIIINDIEVKPMGGIYGVEFDDEGHADIWFVPIRPGVFEYYVRGYKKMGMVGKFIVD
jgi:hypothetical protein